MHDYQSIAGLRDDYDYLKNDIPYKMTWDCGFPKDERAKKAKCSLLGKEYAFIMLTLDINIHKDKVITEAKELFNENKD
ncbi:hypothetical protein R6Q59_018719 [Mikania micrantha]